MEGGRARVRSALLSRLQRSEQLRSQQGLVMRQLKEKVLKYRARSQELEQQLEAAGVSSQEESARHGLEQLHHQSSHPEHAVAQESEEKDLLVHEKAILEKRLAAMEQDGQSLSEQLAEARSAKQALESSLLETQHRLSQLEMVKSDLEIQLHAVTQAKEVMEELLRSEGAGDRSFLH
ncbi:rootletin-like [Apus apus]|uniref:rootletin-like n=1 Tax=Apus apus TaxID=8895 RepID=UPI0021F89758|nr:rootletin-like [Apus apus]